MHPTLLPLLALPLLSSASSLILRQTPANRPCGCPTLGQDCIIKKAPLLNADQPNSAFCGTLDSKYSYSCDGSYNSPNCNACAQSLLGNIQQPGRTKQCDGGKFCSPDNGATWHVCARDEAPFVPAYFTTISYSGSDSAAQIASGDAFDLKWLHNTLPSWFKSVCYENSCQASPKSWPSQTLAYPGPGLQLVQGSLTFGISESQYQSADERDTMVQLATLAVIRAAKCEKKVWRIPCTKENAGDCGTQPAINICHGPSDVNVQMNRWENGQSSLHAFIHFQLKWDDHSQPFDCSILETPLSVVDEIGNLEPEAKGAADKAGVVMTVCKAFQKLLDMSGKAGGS